MTHDYERELVLLRERRDAQVLYSDEWHFWQNEIMRVVAECLSQAMEAL